MGLAFSLLPMKCAYHFQQISLQLDTFSWFVYTGGTCTSVGAYLARNIVQTEYTNSCTLICGLMSGLFPSFVPRLLWPTKSLDTRPALRAHE